MAAKDFPPLKSSTDKIELSSENCGNETTFSADTLKLTMEMVN